MEREEWLNQMRHKSEEIYDRLSPLYWSSLGLYPNETHQEFMQKFLSRLAPGGSVLSAACGAGRYDGILLDAGQSVVGIDQSAGMLARAVERFPAAQYEKMGLQEMDFLESFDGAICMDAMEHICPEDWPGILRAFHKALKPGGLLYITVEVPEPDEVEEAYERARARGLPVLPGELADGVDEAHERIMALQTPIVPGDVADAAVYHYYPSWDQVQGWLAQAGFVIEEQGTGNGYKHLILRRQ